MFQLNFPSTTLTKSQLNDTDAATDLVGWEREILAFAQVWDDTPETITVNTSGSTGDPKAIKLHTLSMRKSAEITIKYFGLEPGARALLCLPVQYIAGKMMVVRAMEGNWDLHCSEPSLTPMPRNHKGFDFVAMTPAQVERSLEADANCFDEVRTVIVGGAAVQFSLLKRLQTLDTAFFATYGMTETCTHVAVQRLNGPNATQHFEALPGYILRKNSLNCLTISYDHLVGDVIVTTDRVEFIEKDKFLWMGRNDGAINSGGVKIFPERVEEKLAPYLEMPFYISSRPDPTFAEQVVLVLKGPKLSKPDASVLMSDLKGLLTPFEVPKAIVYLDTFELTATGKIKRQKF